MKIRYWTLLVITGMLTGRLHAYMADTKTCKNAFSYLQTGAYSHVENLKSMQKKLHRFPLCMEKDGRIVRLFVALPQAKGTRRWYIKKVKSIVPDAFVKRDVTHLLTYNSGDKHESADAEALDSRAILQTRKKFF